MTEDTVSVPIVANPASNVQTLTIGKTTYLVTANYSGKESIDKKIAKLIERKLENGQ